MKTIQAFEASIRGAKYPNFEAARTALKNHAMTVEYVLALLIERDVLDVGPDGSLNGVTLAERVESRGGLHVPGVWSVKWPSKDSIRNALVEADGPIKFRALQARLREKGEKHANHWAMVRAVAFMEKQGIVGRQDNGALVLIENTGKPVTPAPIEDVEIDDTPSVLEGVSKDYITMLKKTAKECPEGTPDAEIAKVFTRIHFEMLGEFRIDPARHRDLVAQVNAVRGT